MKNRKIGIGTIEINKKFESFEEASRYAKRLRQAISYISKNKGYQVSAITVVSNIKKEISDLRYINNGKRGRPKKELVLYEKGVNDWYKCNIYTDYHIHILIVSKPGFALRNHIKKYIDKNWINIPKIYENKNFYIKKQVYKKECNIKIADYFIDQSLEIRFLNCNFSGEKDFDYTLKDYYSEYMKGKSLKERLHKKYISNKVSQLGYERQLHKAEIRFNLIQDYFYSISKEREEKVQKEYMNKVKKTKIRENYNKLQNRST